MAVKITNKEIEFIYLLILHEEFITAQRSTTITDYEIANLSIKLKNEITARIRNFNEIKEQEEFLVKNKYKLTIKRNREDIKKNKKRG